ncbi:UNVERIFIED_CONTAM: tRNA(His) guanylyltransferase 2 [Sesamum angustifolium]|uniref:tRNA(His) guanylyltransferase n=1 Tax=Sesamum angustifolium TaxID=2727405 RepID=A0AAW2IL14_9LAMI
MNSCAAGVLEEFRDIVFAYGVSDEYSEIVSAVVSFFSSMYAMKWKMNFPHKEMKYPPYFDGRAVCYPSCEILLDYLAWRQVDCHINNQYNTCFWMLVKSGKSKSAAQQYLKGTQAQEKNELLDQLSGTIDYYNKLPLMFRQGSSVYWDKVISFLLSHPTTKSIT